MSRINPPNERRCPSCRIRHKVPPPSWTVEHYNGINADPSTIRFLQYAATFFDTEATRLHTAREFVEWLLPDLRGGVIPRDEAAGRAIAEGGAMGEARTGRTAAPDVIPYASVRRLVG